MPELEQCYPAFSFGRRGILQVEDFLSKTIVFHFVKSVRKMNLARNTSRRKYVILLFTRIYMVELIVKY